MALTCFASVVVKTTCLTQFSKQAVLDVLDDVVDVGTEKPGHFTQVMLLASPNERYFDTWNHQIVWDF